MNNQLRFHSKHIKQKQNHKARLIYLKLGLVTLAFSVFMERAFHCAVLAISSDMFTTEGSMLGNKHTLISSTCLAIPLMRCHTLPFLALVMFFAWVLENIALFHFKTKNLNVKNNSHSSSVLVLN